MYKILEDCVYSEMCQRVEVKKGDVVELPEFVANSWLKRGICELAKKEKFNPVIETAVIDPVKETKAKKKKK